MFFFGIAEPQAAMLASYKAALTAGWSPRPASLDPIDIVRDIDADPSAFLQRLSDRIEAAPHTFLLTRWMWDGEFCGEIKITFDAGAAENSRVDISCVPGNAGHDYEARALRQVRDEMRDLGVDAAALAAMFDVRPAAD